MDLNFGGFFFSSASIKLVRGALDGTDLSPGERKLQFPKRTAVCRAGFISVPAHEHAPSFSAKANPSSNSSYTV